MFGQIIDLLVKKESERRSVIYFLLKIFFTSTLTAKLFESIFGAYRLIPLTDFTAIIDFFIHGNIIVCVALFYLVWFFSFRMISFFLSLIVLWPAASLYNVLYRIVNNPQTFFAPVISDKTLTKFAHFYIKLLNIIGIIDTEAKELNPGIQFYKFYDYLGDVEDDKQEVDSSEHADRISLILQFIFIYQLFNFQFLSAHGWLLLFSMLAIFAMLLSSFIAYVLATMIETKHTNLLNLMDQILSPANQAAEKQNIEQSKVIS
jgi:hypothetical protein